MIRQANFTDIPLLKSIRNSVRENVLSDPSLVSDQDYFDFLTSKGRGWLWEESGEVLGFAVVDLQQHNVWALFVHPEHERKGIGLALQKAMLDWYFSQTDQDIWLGTDPGTRAEAFYRQSGWVDCGTEDNGEVRFEMSREAWLKSTSQAPFSEI